MKVLLYTGGFTHTLYREQAWAVPAGVQLVGSDDLYSAGIKADLAQPGFLVRLTRPIKRAALSAAVTIGTPNVRRVSADGYDLVHSAQYALLHPRPWVVDFEDASVFAWYDPANLARPHVRRILQRLFRSPACRWILPWSEAARVSLLHALDCRPFIDKIRVVYPAIRPGVPAARATDGTVRLLFIGSAFYYKGGLETILAFERLRSHVPVQLTMVTFVPDEIRRRFSGVAGLTFKSRIDPAELEVLYQSTDLLVAPFHTDTFGFVLLEAFARGIPCIVARQFATPEIVSHGVTGIVVDNHVSRFGSDLLPRHSLLGAGPARMLREVMAPPDAYVDALAAAIESLVIDRQRRLAMSEAAFKEVTDGKFSIQARRAAMTPIYTA